MDEKRDKTDPYDFPQAREKHQGEWQGDLNPSFMSGQNIGGASDDREQALPTAYDVKDVHRELNDRFEDDELRQIPVLREGQRLQQGGTYVDLHDPERREFTAMGDMAAAERNWYVPKDRVPYSLWNRLIGVENPDRVAERPDRDRLD